MSKVTLNNLLVPDESPTYGSVQRGQYFAMKHKPETVYIETDAGPADVKTGDTDAFSTEELVILLDVEITVRGAT